MENTLIGVCPWYFSIIHIQYYFLMDYRLYIIDSKKNNSKSGKKKEMLLQVFIMITLIDENLTLLNHSQTAFLALYIIRHILYFYRFIKS